MCLLQMFEKNRSNRLASFSQINGSINGSISSISPQQVAFPRLAVEDRIYPNHMKTTCHSVTRDVKKNMTQLHRRILRAVPMTKWKKDISAIAKCKCKRLYA
ncbi:hypothetical protein GQX74_006730 [Glossina fuscipes]|nr:hypothetical protein GQX74_006730 [Glossina fuscipes]